MSKTRVLAAALVASAALLAGCQSVKTTSAGAVGVERTQRMSSMVSEADMRQQAELAYRETLSPSGRRAR